MVIVYVLCLTHKVQMNALRANVAAAKLAGTAADAEVKALSAGLESTERG